MKTNTHYTPRIREGTAYHQDSLWQKIAAFRFDDPAAALPFSRKLARENKWDPAFTHRAINEYRRFIYLCCISPTGASPSYITDQVWHLHLLYTQNYWEEFCDKTLGIKLHHHPSKGGPPEKARHDTWQDQTLELYQAVFGESPPADIWHDSPPPFRLFPRIVSRIFHLRSLFPFLLLTSVFLTGCTAGGIAFSLLLLVILIYHTARNSKKDSSDTSSGCNSGSSCGSSCSSGSSCGSGGGGCGGCGGGGGD